MDDDIAKVQNKPAGLSGTLGLRDRDVLFGQRTVDFVNDRLKLSFGLAVTHDKVISETAYLADIEQKNIKCLPLQRGIDYLPGYLSTL